MGQQLIAHRETFKEKNEAFRKAERTPQIQLL